MLKWPSQNTTTTTLIHKASVGNISFTLTMSKLSLSWFIIISSLEFITNLWSFVFIKFLHQWLGLPFIIMKLVDGAFHVPIADPCHSLIMLLGDQILFWLFMSHGYLGTQHREQLKKGVEKGANLIKLAEHGPLRRDEGTHWHSSIKPKTLLWVTLSLLGIKNQNSSQSDFGRASSCFPCWC